MAKITGMARWWKPFKIKIKAYLQYFYPLDIDDSYIEYVISEMKYDDSDISLLDGDSIAKFRTRTALCHLWQVRRVKVSTKELKIFRVIPLKYVWKIIDILYICTFITCGTVLIK